jgi:hypothetical protein
LVCRQIAAYLDAEGGNQVHPILSEIQTELKGETPQLIYKFALRCVEEIASNLEDDAAIQAFAQFKRLVTAFNLETMDQLKKLANDLQKIAQSHQGSKSLDGTRHAAVSATYALSKAAEGDALQAAAYSAYSSIYGYGGYAVNDPDSFAEVHQRQLDQLLQLKLKIEQGVPK